MDAAIWGALIAGVVALLSLVVGFANTRNLDRFKQERAAVLEGDRELRNRRIETYQRLWCLFDGFPLDRDPRPNRDEIDRLSLELRRWYYRTGGLLMTDASREAFFRLQAHLRALRKEMKADRVLKRKHYLALFDMASALRTNLTADVFSRDEALITQDDERRIRADTYAGLTALLVQKSITLTEYLHLKENASGQ